MATINVRESLETVIGGKAIRRGTRSRPYTITAASGLHFGKTYSIANGATSTQIFDAGASGDLASPVLVRIEWSDGPVEISWGVDTTVADADTSSFVSNDAVGGFLYLWGSGMYEHDGLAASDRNGFDGGASANIGIGKVFMSQTSGAAITVEVDAFK